MYLFTSSDKTIHRDLELLTSTSYTAVGFGFGPQGVPAEKPRNLLTHPPSQRVWDCCDCCCSVRIYIWDLKRHELKWLVAFKVLTVYMYILGCNERSRVLRSIKEKVFMVYPRV